MKKLFTLVAVALMAVGASAQQTVWNFSDWTAQTFTSEYTQDGLTVAATADQSVTIDGNKKTITGANNTYECTQRLKFGGAGGSGADGEYRYVKFDVTGDCTINVGLQSSSSGSDRILNVATGTFDNVASTMSALGSPAQEQSFTYTGEATTIYLYSTSGGINLYYIEVTPSDPSGINSVNVEKENANAPMYNLAGQRVNNNAKGIVIQNGKKFIKK